MDWKFTEWLSPRWLSPAIRLKTGRMICRRQEVLGLDIGTSAVKMVALRKDNSHRPDSGRAGYIVDAAAVAEIAANDDPNQQKINTIKAIHDCLKSAGTRRKLAVCGVSGPEVAVRDFEFPSLPAEEIAEAVKLEASQICPFNAGDGAVDYQVIPDSYLHVPHGMAKPTSDDYADNKTKGILVAATNKLIKNKVQLAKEAHLKCVLMDVDGLALLNCFNELAVHQGMPYGNEHEKPRAESPGDSTRRTTAILNAGASNMTIAIMGANGCPFIRDMAYAGDDIIEQIAAEKNTTNSAVKEVLFGSTELAEADNSKDVKTEFHHSLEKACCKVTADIAETLRYYSAHVKSTNVDRIYVCGGFALATGFVELLNSQLEIEAAFWNPFDKINCDNGQQYKDIFTKKGPAMAVAAGLAMRSI